MNAEDERLVEQLRARFPMAEVCVSAAIRIQRLSAREQELVKENERQVRELDSVATLVANVKRDRVKTRADALEEAAKVCDNFEAEAEDWIKRHPNEVATISDIYKFTDGMADGSNACATAIRALIAPQEKQKDAET